MRFFGSPRQRARGRRTPASPFVAGLLGVMLFLTGGTEAAPVGETPSRPSPLNAVTGPSPAGRAVDPLPAARRQTVHEIAATGPEILALSEGDRQRLVRWIRRGGRLLLGGDAVNPVLQFLVPSVGAITGGAHALGLGEVVVVDDLDRPGSAIGGGGECELFGSARILARSTRPGDRSPGLAAALRLVGYGLLLCLGFSLTTRTPRALK